MDEENALNCRLRCTQQQPKAGERARRAKLLSASGQEQDGKPHASNSNTRTAKRARKKKSEPKYKIARTKNAGGTKPSRPAATAEQVVAKPKAPRSLQAKRQTPPQNCPKPESKTATIYLSPGGTPEAPEKPQTPEPAAVAEPAEAAHHAGNAGKGGAGTQSRAAAPGHGDAGAGG